MTLASDSPAGVTEETYENEATGVETEHVADTAPEVDKPWAPEQIRVSTKTFSLRSVLDNIDDGDLELAPDFQRGKVWKLWQKSRLIESLLLQIPLPAFYFAEDADGMMRVVDGLQRLSTIYDFVRGDGTARFALQELEYLRQEHGKEFEALSAPWRRRINNAQIVVHVIDPSTPAGVKYDIFKRINTGGTPLNTQEIRHCMSKPRSRDFLKRLTHLESFDAATGGMSDHIRMNDREMALRFSAFRLLGVDGYDEYRAMDPFLEEVTRRLDDHRQVSDAVLQDLERAFDRAMRNAREVFADHAFRKWPTYSESRSPINRPLFESWALALADYEQHDVRARKDAIVLAARKLMTVDPEYTAAITSSTGDPKKVRYRFAMSRQASSAGGTGL